MTTDPIQNDIIAGLEKTISHPRIPKSSDDTCPTCGCAWDEHEFGVPAPYCPVTIDKIHNTQETVHETILRDDGKVFEAALKLPVKPLMIPEDFTSIQSLSPREFQLLQLLATGAKTGALARQLGLSAKTLDSYFCSIRAKLGVKNVWALRVLAARFVEWMEREKVERREVPERWSFRRVAADKDQPSDSREPSNAQSAVESENPSTLGGEI